MLQKSSEPSSVTKMPDSTMTSKCRIRDMFLSWYFITCLGVPGVTAETCYSPVHLELGKTGTLQCSFPDGFHSVQWYDAEDIVGEAVIIAYDESREKDGSGYWSGEFDVHPNGSLIIRNVSIKHETTFTVTMFQTTQELPQHYQVHVKTVVKPLRSQPVVSSCENTLGSCYIEWTQSTDVSCRIEHSRPAINITWYLWNFSSDNIVPFGYESSSDDMTHTTAVLLQDASMYQTNLTVYVCKADDPIGLLEEKETTVLLEKKDIDWSHIPVIEIHGVRYSNVDLPCTQRSPRIVVWKKGDSVKNLVTTVHDVPSEDDLGSPMPDRWKLEADSSLTIQEVQITDESTYACHSYDGTKESFDVYKLKVIAEACYSPVHLELGKTGTLQCSFPEGFHSVQWYDAEDIVGEAVIIAYDESREKDGSGYRSGEFEVHPNGSLIIRNVSIEHETTFTVTMFETTQELPQHYQVHVKTVVKPSRSQPVVSSCENMLGSCYMEWTQSTNVSCRIEHSRPAINITWSVRNSSSDNLVPFEHFESWSDATTHTTAVMLQDPFMHQLNLGLYVCKADDPIGLLEKKETTVLLERKDIDWSSIPVIEILGERHSNVNLPCTQRSPRIVVWKKGDSVKKLVTTIYDVPSEDDLRSPVPARWKLEANSSLTIQEIQFADESTYACHSYNGKMQAFDVYELKVIDRRQEMMKILPVGQSRDKPPWYQVVGSIFMTIVMICYAFVYAVGYPPALRGRLH